MLSLQDYCHFRADSLLLAVSPFLEHKQAQVIHIAWVLVIFSLDDAIDFISLVGAVHVRTLVVHRFTLPFRQLSFELFLCLRNLILVPRRSGISRNGFSREDHAYIHWSIFDWTTRTRRANV